MMRTLLTLLVLGSALASAASAKAQRPVYAGGLVAGSGVSFGDGQKTVVVQRSPLFLDLSFRYWSTEQDWLVVGASARVEIDGRTSVAAVPRLEYQLKMGPLLLRPGIGAPFVLAPRTMFGVEGGLTARLELAGAFGLLATVYADAFFLGDDVPDDSVVVMLNGALGVDLQF
jgi:hypothetical protein